jgi:putative tryptophan/tyrosine transport system substrate-binding protein
MEASTELQTPEEAAAFRELAAELVRLRVDGLIVTTTHATQTIPIVMTTAIDPGGAGFVASLARPGGTVTGNSRRSPERSTTRLALLQDVVPGLAPMVVLGHAAHPANVSVRSNAPSALR